MSHPYREAGEVHYDGDLYPWRCAGCKAELCRREEPETPHAMICLACWQASIQGSSALPSASSALSPFD